MAVVLDEPSPERPKDEGERAKPERPKWAGGLEYTASLLAIFAILGYLILRLSYGQFYSALGVEPSDVGLGYANTIANSAEYLFYSVLTYGVSAVLAGAVIGVVMLVLYRDLSRWRRHFALLIRLSIPLILLFLLLYSFYRFLNLGAYSAQAVREGRPVAYGQIGPFVVGLGAGAQPAVVRPTGKPTESRSLTQLSGRTLFYLGKADGIAVLYDVENQSAIYLPLSAAVIEVSNCRVAESVDPICRKRV